MAGGEKISDVRGQREEEGRCQRVSTYTEIVLEDDLIVSPDFFSYFEQVDTFLFPAPLSPFLLPPSSFLLPPSSFLLPPSSFLLPPSSFLLLPPSSSLIRFSFPFLFLLYCPFPLLSQSTNE
jgi:hypothetical protein